MPTSQLPIDTSLQDATPSAVSNSALPSYDATSYDPSGYESGVYDATTYDATSYDATTKDLTGDQLVSANLDKVLDKGGVLMDVARSAGDEYANSRGMLNSSMGAQSSMRSMIDSALPIASQDASSQLSQLQANQGYENQASQFNTAAENQAREYGATTQNRSSEFNIDSQNRASEFTANAENTAGQFNAVSENEAARFAATNEVQQTRDSILQSYQLQMENLSTNNKALLIDLEQKYSAAIQSDRNASEAYMQVMDTLGGILSNGDLSPDQQIAATGDIIDQLAAYLDFNKNLNAVNSVSGDTIVSDNTGADSNVTDEPALTDQQVKTLKFQEYSDEVSSLGNEWDFAQTYRDQVPNGSDISAFEAATAAGKAAWARLREEIESKYSEWLG